MPRFPLADGYTISRIIIGGWQLSEGHTERPPDRESVLEAWARMVDAGLTTFDCADIYTGVEELIGEFVRRRPRTEIQVHTKLVPDRDDLARVDRAHVERIVDRSLRRLGVEVLDLVQLAWWDYEVPGFVEAALWLVEQQQAGKVRHIGTTNFDVLRLEAFAEAGVPLVAHQVQYSLLDHRPERGMIELCRRRDARLLCYGTLAGGFLSERYLGADEPAVPLANRSLTKYRLIIDEFGGWEAFQSLLRVLAAVGVRHGVSIANVALRYVLDRPQVGAVIVGATSASHLESNLRVFDFSLDDEDLTRLDAVSAGRGPPGDVFEIERDSGGRHAAIMRYNLNREAPDAE